MSLKTPTYTVDLLLTNVDEAVPDPRTGAAFVILDTRVLKGLLDDWVRMKRELHQTRADLQSLRTVLRQYECPECGADDVERVQSGAFNCGTCGHAWDADGEPVGTDRLYPSEGTP